MTSVFDTTLAHNYGVLGVGALSFTNSNSTNNHWQHALPAIQQPLLHSSKLDAHQVAPSLPDNAAGRQTAPWGWHDDALAESELPTLADLQSEVWDQV